MNQATAMPCHILRVCHHSGNRASCTVQRELERASFIALELGRQMNDTRNTQNRRDEGRGGEGLFVTVIPSVRPVNLLLRYLRARPLPR